MCWVVVASILGAGNATAAVTPDALKPGTAACFDGYVKVTEARNESELHSATNLLWIDSLPQNERAQAYAVLSRGVVEMQR